MSGAGIAGGGADAAEAAGESRGRGMLRDGAAYLGIVLIGVALWFLLGHVNAFYSNILASIMIWTIATSGLNLIAGLGGYPSLVQGAFYGIGAYASSVALAQGQPLWVATVLAMALAGAAGLAVGIIFSRTRGQYFAIGTLFFGAVAGLVMNNWATVTQGPIGLSVPFAVPDLETLNALIAVCMVLSLALVVFIGRRRLGLRLVAVREDEDLAEHVGVPTAWTKLAAFVLSACVGGLAGVLIAQYNGTISPELFDYYVGFVMFVALAVGGAGRVLGPLLGSTFIVGVPHLLNLSSGIGQLLVGIVFVAVMILVPGGFMSAVDAVLALFRRGGQKQ